MANPEPAPKYIKGLVSIGIPTYNRPKLLQRALEIAASQTYKDIEIVVSDNGSPDSEVARVVREFAAKDTRLKAYRQDRNIGILANTEFVLRKAAGEYFAWLSDDDWRSPEFIETLVAELEKHKEVNLAFCEYHEVYEDGTLATEYPPTHLQTFQPFQSNSRIIRTSSYYLQDSFNGKCNLLYSVFRKTALDQLDFKKISGNYGNMNTDSLLVFNMLQKGPAIIVPKAMCTLTCGNRKHYAEEFGVAVRKAPGVLPKLKVFFGEHFSDLRLFLENAGRLDEKAFICAVFFPRLMTLLFKAVFRKVSKG